MITSRDFSRRGQGEGAYVEVARDLLICSFSQYSSAEVLKECVLWSGQITCSIIPASQEVVLL